MRENEEDLFADAVCDTENVSFASDVSLILSNNCLVCHSTAANLGNVRLQAYEDVVRYVNNGKLMGSIRHDSGFIAMPPTGAKLNDCDISRLEAWILDGFPNN